MNVNVWFRAIRLASPFLFLLSTAAVPATAHPSLVKPWRVLFVGNSITYTNNLPAIFCILVHAERPGSRLTVAMFVKGGATLKSLYNDPRLHEALRDGHYSAVIFQERGGNDICVSSAERRRQAPCKTVTHAHVELSDLAHRDGAKVYYLGTYQKLPAASRALVKGERWLSKKMEANYIEISQPWQRLWHTLPKLHWLYGKSNLHPGTALTVLMAIQIYRVVFGALPQLRIPPMSVADFASCRSPDSRMAVG